MHTTKRKYRPYRDMNLGQLTARLTERVLKHELSEEEKAFILRRYMPALEAKAAKRATRSKQAMGWFTLIDPLRVEMASVYASINYYKQRYQVADDEAYIYGKYYAVLYTLASRLRAEKNSGKSVTQFKQALARLDIGLPLGKGDHWTDYIKRETKDKIWALWQQLPPGATGGRARRQPFHRNTSPKVRQMKATSVAATTTTEGDHDEA